MFMRAPVTTAPCYQHRDRPQGSGEALFSRGQAMIDC